MNSLIVNVGEMAYHLANEARAGLNEFIQAIREGTPVHPSFDEGVQYMEFCEAVGQSVYFGKVVDLPPEPVMATWGRTL